MPLLTLTPHLPYALPALLIILIASAIMFVWNVRRSTAQRPRLELLQWARANRLTLLDDPAPSALPPVLPTLLPDARWDTLLHDTPEGPGSADAATPTSPLRTLARCVTPHGTHHLLVLRTPSADWPPTALRPAHAAHALPDRLPDLRPYPSLPGTERFTTLGTTLHAARLLADSPLRTLLPPDLPLLLHGPWLLLDFSTRPFDTLAFSRLLPLADQLLRNLPTPA